MKKKYFFKKPITPVTDTLGNEISPLPCRNLREEFDFVLSTNYKQHVTPDLLRLLWQNASALLIKNPSADIHAIAHQTMADYLGIITPGTA